jgi:hypothetical protein
MLRILLNTESSCGKGTDLALSSSGFIDRHRDDTKTRASPLDAICRPLDDAVLRKFGDVLSDI